MEEEEHQQSSPADGVPPEVIQRIEHISQQVDLIEVENVNFFFFRRVKFLFNIFAIISESYFPRTKTSACTTTQRRVYPAES